jgi:ABC-type multidrug transport system fused ATPase/permease subunit
MIQLFLRYVKELEDARLFGIKKNIASGAVIAFIFLIIYCAYALGFWYGWKLSIKPDSSYTIGKILLVFFSVLIGMGSLGSLGPYFSTLSTSLAAAYEIFEIIDRVTLIYFIIIIRATVVIHSYLGT